MRLFNKVPRKDASNKKESDGAKPRTERLLKTTEGQGMTPVTRKTVRTQMLQHLYFYHELTHCGGWGVTLGPLAVKSLQKAVPTAGLREADGGASS